LQRQTQAQRHRIGDTRTIRIAELSNGDGATIGLSLKASDRFSTLLNQRHHKMEVVPSIRDSSQCGSISQLG